MFYRKVEGYGIQDVMGKPGVDGKNTKTNHIVEVTTILMHAHFLQKFFFLKITVLYYPVRIAKTD